MRSLFPVLPVFALLLSSTLTHGHLAAATVEVQVTNGDVIVGEVGEETATTLELKRLVMIRHKPTTTSVTVPKNIITKRKDVPSLTAQYETRRAKVDSSLFDQCALARWCLDHALMNQAIVHTKQAESDDSFSPIVAKLYGRAGFGADSRVHAVGDGAPWIVGQIEDLFGEQGSYLIDFYHVCEYLSAAAKTIAPDVAAGKAWMEAQKDALKTGRASAVLSALLPHRESLDVSDEQAPVRVCHRYLSARKDQLNYREALAEGLPIGSGEIESAHRYVAQKRLKLPGAWWLVEHAEHMLALRINRLNGDWEAYWAALAANPPANLNRPEVSTKVAA